MEKNEEEKKEKSTCAEKKSGIWIYYGLNETSCDKWKIRWKEDQKRNISCVKVNEWWMKLVGKNEALNWIFQQKNEGSFSLKLDHLKNCTG